jgi:hypothetical protein
MSIVQSIENARQEHVGPHGIGADALKSVLARAESALDWLRARHADGRLPLLRLPETHSDLETIRDPARQLADRATDSVIHRRLRPGGRPWRNTGSRTGRRRIGRRRNTFHRQLTHAMVPAARRDDALYRDPNPAAPETLMRITPFGDQSRDCKRAFRYLPGITEVAKAGKTMVA